MLLQNKIAFRGKKKEHPFDFQEGRHPQENKNPLFPVDEKTFRIAAEESPRRGKQKIQVQKTEPKYDSLD